MKSRRAICFLWVLLVCVFQTGLFHTGLGAITWPIVYATLDEHPASGMFISWITPVPDANDTISYRPDNTSDKWSKATGSHTLLQTKVHVVHHVHLAKLASSTLYQFKLPNKDTVYSFKTLPDKPPIAFVVGGDTNQRGIERFIHTNKAAAATNPQFCVFGGDLAYACRGSQDLENFNGWLQWLDAYASTMTYKSRLIPLAVAAGNHDVNGGGFGKLPKDAETLYSLFPALSPRGYNTIRIDNWLAIYLLDSGHANPIDGKQCQWLREQMSRDLKTKNRFAVYHIPAYPVKSKHPRAESKLIGQHWSPLFEIYELHAAFENHEHVYKRTYPIIGGKRKSNGVIYMGGGAWGADPRHESDNPSYLAYSKNCEHFVYVLLEKDYRIILARSSDGAIIDLIAAEYK